MSGGVDSSLVAACLHELGHEVIGVTLQLYDNGAASGRPGACCAGQDIHDARQVAARLGIPHYVLDYEATFRRAVIDEFAASYAKGETPLPCATCNRTIKFGHLLDTAAELGADVMATGHYVTSEAGPRGVVLRRAADAARDQSYFLYAMTAAQLARLWFPLGDMHKSDVRELARRHGLEVAGKSDSQDICFVPSGHYASVVEKLRPDAIAPGEIVHLDGRVLGQHEGIMRFTVGQRRGLGIAAAEPLFVVRLDAGARRVVVGPRAALATATLELRDPIWLGDDELAAGDTIRLAARIRSTQAPRPATLQVGVGGSMRIVLEEPEYGVAAGQACVFYADLTSRARVLGGGIISRALSCTQACPPGVIEATTETLARRTTAASEHHTQPVVSAG
jgi:tRNA-specific 2-thiouridylase